MDERSRGGRGLLSRGVRDPAATPGGSRTSKGTQSPRGGRCHCGGAFTWGEHPACHVARVPHVRVSRWHPRDTCCDNVIINPSGPTFPST